MVGRLRPRSSIHARIHKILSRAAAAFHTQMPNATALSMVEGEPLVWAGIAP
ncbi:class II aldolase/adducin family protein [Bradyrhizobium yuanmingense]|uniref:class II aldolase/adducin family protein n=1 Tax=Bradyrhizobium yuanmingense TaxID=108015 RepID=UPI003B96DB8D